MTSRFRDLFIGDALQFVCRGAGPSRGMETVNTRETTVPFRSKSPAGANARAGFTLIELMIVVAILAVLAAIAVPSYQSYIYNALVVQAQSDIKSLDVAIAQYYADTRGFPGTLADIGKNGMLDPWQNPYQYLRLSPPSKGSQGQARKDKNLVPINSDYDLYSMGRDGTSNPPLTSKASRDDIVRASNGRFVGLASGY